MFKFDLTQIFKEKIREVLVVLCSLYLGGVVFSLVLKWIHPYLKSAPIDDQNKDYKFDRTTLNKNQNIMQDNDKTDKSYYKSGRLSSEEGYLNLISCLKSSVDISNIPQQHLKKVPSESDLLNELCLEIINVMNKRRSIRDNRKSKKSTREAQTNISISPQINADNSSPQLIISCESTFCKVPIHKEDSSDSFQSISSEQEVNNCLQEVENSRVYNFITSIEKTEGFSKSEVTEYDTLLDSDTDGQVLKACLESLRLKNYIDYGKQVRKENKILELAIHGFENELKPIKDQIKNLKECLNSFENYEMETDFLSDFSSLSSDPATKSECYSEDISTTCDSFSNSLLSKNKRKRIPLKVEIQLNRCESPSEENRHISQISNSVSKINHANIYRKLQKIDKFSSCSNEMRFLEKRQSSTVKNTLHKRSPMADMYIKLSHCSSKTANFIKQHSCMQKSPDECLKCHINFSLKLDSVTFSNTNMKNLTEENNMQPVLSDPEDILGGS